MKHHYADAPTRSIVSLHPSPSDPTAWWITRVSVLPPHRQKGIAGRLLDAVCADADAEGVTLWLHVVPDVAEDGLDDMALCDFYERRGFEHAGDLHGELVRSPR